MQRRHFIVYQGGGKTFDTKICEIFSLKIRGERPPAPPKKMASLLQCNEHAFYSSFVDIFTLLEKESINSMKNPFSLHRLQSLSLQCHNVFCYLCYRNYISV